MQTLIALLVAAAAACAIARPPGPTAASAPLLGQEPRLMREPPPPPPPREFLGLGDYLLPRILLPQYTGYVDSPVIAPPMPYNDWLSKEIDHISQMEDDVDLMSPYEADLLRWYSQNVYLQNMLDSPINIQEPEYVHDSVQNIIDDIKPIPMVEPETPLNLGKPSLEAKRSQSDHTNTSSDERKKFAFTPLDPEFYAPVPKHEQMRNKPRQAGHAEGIGPRVAMLLEPPRQTRQNPNLSKQKHLLEPDLGKLKTGLTRKEYRLPVSLLPANLGWLKVIQPERVDHDDDDDNHLQQRSHEHEEGAASNQHHVHLLDPTTDPAESIFSVALIAAVAAALTMALVGFAFGWYTLAKRAKAAADVDYPAYGVTGPTVDSSGDRKLAHSAHMYHYQHQKQQIIAMERNGLEQQRAGSVSDPESEEENEEGDYTVYECPGFATTGDMEVKNPLFSEDPTPVTPGKCEVVKQQPKD